MASDKGDMLRFPVSRALMSVTVDASSKAEWDLSFAEASNKVMELIASHAEDQGVAHTGELGCVDKTQKPITINVEAIHDRMHGTAPSFSSMDGFHAWRSEWSANLFVQILLESDGKMTPSKAKLSGILWIQLLKMLG